MANNLDTNKRDLLELFTDEQINSIKEIVLQSVMNILPNIIKEITPNVVKSIQEFTQTQLMETLPQAEIVQESQTSIKETARNFENSKSNYLNNKLKARNDYNYKLTRCLELTKLYTEGLNEEPSYIPKQFRESKPHKMSKEEEIIYTNLSTQKLQAEIQVLQIRANTNREKVEQIDSQVKDFFISNVDNPAVLEELNNKWELNINADEEKVINSWKKKINDERKIIQKDKASIANEDSTASATPKPNQNTQRPPRKYYNTNPSTNQRQQNQRFPQNPNYNASKNYQSRMPPPPRLLPLNSSTFHPSHWQPNMYHY